MAEIFFVAYACSWVVVNRFLNGDAPEHQKMDTCLPPTFSASFLDDPPLEHSHTSLSMVALASKEGRRHVGHHSVAQSFHESSNVLVRPCFVIGEEIQAVSLQALEFGGVAHQTHASAISASRTPSGFCL